MDEDNWFDPNHVETMLQMINMPGRNHEWCYSLRKCVDQEDNYLFNDDCDSLGIFASWKNINLVDMNCYCFGVGTLLQILRPNVPLVVAGRLFFGIGAGGSTVVIPVYLGEISPPDFRGIGFDPFWPPSLSSSVYRYIGCLQPIVHCAWYSAK